VIETIIIDPKELSENIAISIRTIEKNVNEITGYK